MKGLNIVALALSLVVAGLAQAANFTVSDIRIEGLQQVEPGIVFRNFPISRGNQVDDQRLNDATRDLFATGYFDDVEILRDEDVLVLRLTERPAVSLIRIDGEKLIKEEQLRDALRRAGLDEGEIFRRSALELVRLELLKVYNEAGRYTASVETEVEEVSGNRVALNIVVTEGETAVVKQINIIGNNAFDDETLTDLFDTGLTNMWSFWTDNDKYARETVSADIERLKSYYLDRGYAKFEVNSTDVSISPDQKQVYITVSVNEGLQYRINEIKLAGDYGVEESELRDQLVITEGDLFSRKSIGESQQRMSDLVGEAGYLFSRITPVPAFPGDDAVELTFFIEPGKLTYVRRIEIIGNYTTSDEVIRREIPQMEGAIAGSQLIKKAKTRLDRLGYFSSVLVETKPVAGTDDQVDLEIKVEEQMLGQISAGIGFSSSEGLGFQLGLQQDNFLGSGNRFGFEVNTSAVETTYSANYFNPYYTLDGVSRGYNAYYRSRDFQENDIANYNTNEVGASVNFGYPINDDQRVKFGVGVDQTEVALQQNTNQGVIQTFVGNNSLSETYLTYELSLGWNSNTLNSGFFPTRGLYQDATLSVAVPGGDLSYFKFIYDGKYYRPINIDETWVLGFRTLSGFAESLDDNDYPFYKNFFAGGRRTVRGFANNSLGPRDSANSDIIGGNILLSGTAEFIFPIPFVDDKDQFRTSLFVDAGNVYSTNCIGQTNCSENIELGELRAAAGFGLSWLTAIGPLSISYAKALNEKPGDITESVQFVIGRTF